MNFFLLGILKTTYDVLSPNFSLVKQFYNIFPNSCKTFKLRVSNVWTWLDTTLKSWCSAKNNLQNLNVYQFKAMSTLFWHMVDNVSRHGCLLTSPHYSVYRHTFFFSEFLNFLELLSDADDTAWWCSCGCFNYHCSCSKSSLFPL